jgi:hypothetical protein
MNRHLSSHLTPVFKFVFPAIWSAAIIGAVILILVDSHDISAVIILPMILLMWAPVQLKQITYDDRNVYIYNWRKTKTFALTDIKSINDGQLGTFDPFFELEIRDKDGRTQKIDFLPHVKEHLIFSFTNQYTGHLLTLKTKLVNNKRQASGAKSSEL